MYVHLVIQHVSECYLEAVRGDLCTRVFGFPALGTGPVSWGFGTRHTQHYMAVGQVSNHKKRLQNIHIMMHVYAVFANCMKPLSDLFP